jgi:tetratricopeptide (TPR) repeat protein
MYILPPTFNLAPDYVIRTLFVLIAFCFIPFMSRGQGPNLRKIDSLISVLPKVDDTTRVILLVTLSRETLFGDTDESVTHAKEAIRLSRTIDFRDGLAMGHTILGGYYMLVKSDFPVSKAYLDSALDDNASPRILRMVYYMTSMWHSQQGEYDKSHQILADALKISSVEDDTTAVICGVMGYNLNKIGRRREATTYFKKAIRIYERKPARKSSSSLAATLNNLGSVYMDRDYPDSAMAVFKRVYEIERKFGNPRDNPGLLANLGKLYLMKGNLDSAYQLMHTALRAPSIAQTPYALHMCLGSMALLQLSHHADSAIYYGRRLLKLVDNQSPVFMEEAYGVLAKAYAKKGRFDSAYFYQEKFQQYHDQVFNTKRTQQIAELEASFANEHQKKEIERLKAVQAIGIFRRNALATGLGLMIVITALLIYSFRSKMKARKKEIVYKNAQLEDYIQALIQKSELVEEMRAEAEHLRHNKATTDRQRVDSLSQILSTNSSILTEDDWDRFKILYEQVHPGFFADLRLKFPALSAAETRLCALLKLNLPTREIANMLAISADSVNKARYRLRKKLELEPSEELHNVIDGIA